MKQPSRKHDALATDLDGTLIPLADAPENERDLAELARSVMELRIPLVYVTGRHLESVIGAIAQYDLPVPDWVICDVGTLLYQRQAGGELIRVASYFEHLHQRIAAFPITQLPELVRSLPELRMQEARKQGPFKLSYYTQAEQLDVHAESLQKLLCEARAPYSIIASVDPFTGDGLIDLLPDGVSKGYALEWWVQHTQRAPEQIVFAGDSGNDLAALTCGYRAIVVANARPEVVEAARAAHERSGWRDRLYVASRTATSGVLEGCRWFALC